MFHSKLKARFIKKVDGKKIYELSRALIFEDITVFAGYQTDFASVPEKLQWLYTPQGKYSRSSVIHDFMYDNACYTKEQADETFLRAMKYDGVDFITRRLFYLAVKYYGEGNKS